MWVFLDHAFLSIVAHRSKPNVLLVRARSQPDIGSLFPRVKVHETKAADYRFRAEISRQVVADALAKAALNIDYDNFKASVHEPARHAAYLACWDAMRAFQDGEFIPAGQHRWRLVKTETTYGTDPKLIVD